VEDNTQRRGRFQSVEKNALIVEKNSRFADSSRGGRGDSEAKRLETLLGKLFHLDGVLRIYQEEEQEGQID